MAEDWVVDVRGAQVFFSRLGDQEQYHEVEVSSVLSGLAASLLEEATAKLESFINMEVALWFNKQIAQVDK